MSDSDGQIRDMIRAAVEQDPRVKNKELYERAKEIDADAVKGLTMRQFHGRFRLPVSRAMSGAASAGEPKRRRRSRTATKAAPAAPAASAPVVATKCDAVRDIFRRFAVQLSQAEGRSEIVRAAARIDEFVEEVVQAFAGPDGPGAPPAPRRRTTRRARRETGGPDAADRAAEPAAQPPARDMRRRRRPRALVEALQASREARPAEEEMATAAEAAPTVSEPETVAPEPSPGSSLSHDLEEFRRRRAERERARLVR